MKQTLLTSLLLWSVLLLAEGHGIHAGLSKPARKDGKPAQTTKIQIAQHAPSVPDTSRLSTSRLSGSRTSGSAVVVARFRPAAGLPAPPAAAPAAAAEETAFDPATADLPADLAIALRRPAAPLGKRTYRTRLVRTGRWGSHAEAVEILTCTYAGPLVLAQLPATAATAAQLLAGPGYDAARPLRPLDLTQEAVLRLCGDRAPQVLAYARLYNLHFQQADEVARLFDYYNRIAVAKE